MNEFASGSKEKNLKNLNTWLKRLQSDPKEIKKVAPDAGFEPATKWLTATYSTAELIRNI